MSRGLRLKIDPTRRFRWRSVSVTGYIDPEHQSGDMLQKITGVTARVTEVWTDSRRSERETFVELDCRLSVTLANLMEDVARCLVLKVTQKESSHRFAAWQALWAGTHQSHRMSSRFRSSP